MPPAPSAAEALTSEPALDSVTVCAVTLAGARAFEKVITTFADTAASLVPGAGSRPVMVRAAVSGPWATTTVTGVR